MMSTLLLTYRATNVDGMLICLMRFFVDRHVEIDQSWWYQRMLMSHQSSQPNSEALGSNYEPSTSDESESSDKTNCSVDLCRSTLKVYTDFFGIFLCWIYNFWQNSIVEENFINLKNYCTKKINIREVLSHQSGIKKLDIVK